MLFKEIIGHDVTKKKLVTAVRNEHIPHALLFSGREGSANLAMALAFITYFFCENRGKEDACGVCPSCHKNQKLIHPDVNFSFPFITQKNRDPVSDNLLPEWRNFVLQDPYNSAAGWNTYFGGENKQLYISVDESRQIIRKLSLKPFEARHNIMLIWLPEYMNTPAANALLKIIEEPPDDSIFIIVTNDEKKMMPTILSRTQSIYIRPFTDAELISILVEKHFIDKKEAAKISHLVDGNINEALRLARDVELNSHAMFREWMRLCYTQDHQKLVQFANQYHSLGKVSQQILLQYGLSLLRESLICELGETSLLRVMGEELEFVKKFSITLDPEAIEKLSGLISEASYHLERNANDKIVMLDLSLRASEIFRKVKARAKTV